MHCKTSGLKQLYKNKYRIASARHPYWDYTNAGFYFITICTDNRIHYFGEIQNGFMCLNELGSIVWDEWKKTPIIRPDMNISLAEFIVMPNHVHGIFIIGDNEYNVDGNGGGGTGISNQFGAQRKNVSSIIRGFKSAITIKARVINPNFKWQPRFHDHIIRDDASFQRIANYICNNPFNWDKDKFYYK